MTINIVCLKWGNKYSGDWVNRLYRMVEKNYNQPFNFWCITEDISNIRSEVKFINFPSKHDYLQKWWWKIWFFSEEFPITGKCLFFDLDMVIQNDITPLIDYDFTKPCLLKGKVFKFNSSIILWDTERSNKKIWNQFIKNAQYYVNNRETDDEYFSVDYSKEFKYIPKEWVYSRLQGPLDNNWNGVEIDKIYDDRFQYNIETYRMPHKMICNFNGTNSEFNTPELQKKMMKCYEHYWK